MGTPDPIRTRLAALKARRPELPVLEAPRSPGTDASGREFEPLPAPAELAVNGLAAEAWVLCESSAALGALYPSVLAAALGGGDGPKLLARTDTVPAALAVADLAAFAAVPRMAVGVPGDPASAESALAAAERTAGPVYLRLPPPGSPSVTDGTFEFGRAPLLRPGDDLTVIAAGPPIGLARALADRLHSAGIETRILDGASMKPVDVDAIVRAARETGAILTVEAHHALAGLGAVVAAVTALAYPVPVRRVGYPDLAPGVAGSVASSDAELGLSVARLEEEAWELLRGRGKVQ